MFQFISILPDDWSARASHGDLGHVPVCSAFSAVLLCSRSSPGGAAPASPSVRPIGVCATAKTAVAVAVRAPLVPPALPSRKGLAAGCQRSLEKHPQAQNRGCIFQGNWVDYERAEAVPDIGLHVRALSGSPVEATLWRPTGTRRSKPNDEDLRREPALLDQ